MPPGRLGNLIQSINRRRLFALTGAAALSLGAAPLRVLADDPEPVYGLTRWQTPARREADAQLAPFGSYKSGVMLRLKPVVDDDRWYRVVHDRYRIYPNWAFSSGPIFVRTNGIDLVHEDDIAPVAPREGASDQMIEVILTWPQRVIAWEGSQMVRETLASAGRIYPTPTGHFRVFRKRWARHMQGVDDGVPWDLPGVPYTMYFTGAGHAIHGTYWHNDFGNARSHGCVNIPTDEAKWFYRWVQPTVTDFGTEEYLARGDDPRTQVHVHW